MPRRDCRYQLSRWIPFTNSKCSSWLRIGRAYWRHSAAIQASLAGMGVPARFNSQRSSAY